MPPRAAKRAPAGRGRKRAVRGRAAAAAAAKVKTPPEEASVKAEEEVECRDVMVDEEKPPVVTEEKENEMDQVKEEEDEEEPPVVIEEKEKEMEHEGTGKENEKAEEERRLEENLDTPTKDADEKEHVENEKDEQLNLEENEPEYEPEEYVSIDYDEKEIEQDPQEEIYEVEEEPEEADFGEEEGDVVEEEYVGVPEDLEPEKGHEHVGIDHAEIVDTVDEEHQELFKERLKRKEFEIFVGGLDNDATESDLRGVFNKVGEITEVRLLMNPQTRKNKGFAFLRFATVEQAKRACVELKNPMVHGKQCGVSPCKDSDTLFLGNICKTWTKEALKEKLKHYGVANIEDLTLAEDTNNAGMNRGFAFLEFSSRSDAMDAFRRLQKRNVVFGLDRPAKISFADSFIDPGDEIMAQVKTVFVDCLPATWDEDHVKELLKKYGKIEKVELACNMPSARRKDFGFITFDTHDAAVTCAESINNEQLGEGDKKAKVRARLSRPLQRNKVSNVPRGDFRFSHGPIRGGRGPRGIGARPPPFVDRAFRRPAAIQDRRQVTAVPPRRMPVASLPRSYGRRAPAHPRSGFNRDYGHQEEFPSRSRVPTDFTSRFPSDRRVSYRDDYSHHGSGYPEFSRGGTSQSAARRGAYFDDSYNQRYERPSPLTYHEAHGRGYDSPSGSKRPYTAMDDIAPPYAHTGVRHSRARLDYDPGTSASAYGDAYSDRPGRSDIGYGNSRSSLSSQDPHGFYSGRHGMSYDGGSYSGGDSSGMYPSRFGGGGAEYMSRARDDVGRSSYSSLYSGRSLGGNNYMGRGAPGPYY